MATSEQILAARKTALECKKLSLECEKLEQEIALNRIKLKLAIATVVLTGFNLLFGWFKRA